MRAPSCTPSRVHVCTCVCVCVLVQTPSGYNYLDIDDVVLRITRRCDAACNRRIDNDTQETSNVDSVVAL